MNFFFFCSPFRYESVTEQLAVTVPKNVKRARETERGASAIIVVVRTTLFEINDIVGGGGGGGGIVHAMFY